ncbi:TetR/AcrR family transcriptional regulator [Novosphingobium sp. P6W]|uniref:TetR/AcrR family transcriptional regulator n=1 Tax=Novosphingobium sp. P6W TaxID=1609758 RepID=UPI000695CE41|nr:TetR/AcrR family transcriptional regulator [Novosphingobium sp. P6W]
MPGTRSPERETPVNPPPAPSARRVASIERRRGATRALILEAARLIFASANYAEAKVDDIIRTAGVSRATFYAHFTSKAELAGAIYEAIVPQTTALFARFPTLEEPAQVHAWLDDFVALHLEHRYVTPLIAQLQLFEAGFRKRILRDTDVLIEITLSGAWPETPGDEPASAEGRSRRIALRLLFNRVAAACAEIARGEYGAEDARTCLELLADEILSFLRGPPSSTV